MVVESGDAHSGTDAFPDESPSGFGYGEHVLPSVDTRNPAAVLAECQEIWRRLPVAGAAEPMVHAVDWVLAAFAGREPAYEPLDTPYHDLEHTLQATLCLTRLFAGWNTSQASPQLDARAIQLGTIAALFHDTGYLKDRGDLQGTGAKLTATHVHRSTLVAQNILSRKGLLPNDIRAIQAMILCTAVNARPDRSQFESDLHLMVGCALGTADLLGQMAASDYLQKLPLLHAEFSEAAAAEPPDVPRPHLLGSVQELIEGTPAFWQDIVRPRLQREYRGAYRFLNSPWPDGPNDYLSRIERSLASIPRGGL